MIYKIDIMPHTCVKMQVCPETASKQKNYQNIPVSFSQRKESSKQKLSSSSIYASYFQTSSRLPEINFKNAKTLKEALKFGKNVLGIKEYKGFQEKDTDVLNWIHEGLVNINNLSKGKAVMPLCIKFSKDLGNIPASMSIARTMSINKTETDAAKEFFTQYYSGREIFKDQPEYCLYKKIKEVSTDKSCGIFLYNGVYNTVFNQIYHEMGHLQHFHNLGLVLSYLLSLDDEQLEKAASRFPQNISGQALKIKELFKQNKDIAARVSGYSLKSPFEFAAECYSQTADGIKLNDDIIDLCRKLRGVLPV